MRNPDATLDLPNLSDELATMTAIEFDGWLSGAFESAHPWMSVDDQSERSQLQAMRELEFHAREHDRLTRLIPLATAPSQLDSSAVTSELVESMIRRRADAERQAQKLSHYLETAGWDVRRWANITKEG